MLYPYFVGALDAIVSILASVSVPVGPDDTGTWLPPGLRGGAP